MVNVYADCGSLMVGGVVAFWLSGCFNMQCIVYWQFFPVTEGWCLRLLVMAIWLLDWTHSVFVVVAIWDSVIAPYGAESADVIPWSVGPTVELTAMITFGVQGFFAYRIYKIQRDKIAVAGPVFILAFIRLVSASISMVEMLRLKLYSAFGRPFPSWVFTLGLALSGVVDVVITISLCLSLRSNRSTIQSTNRIINILMVWTIQNGTATCCGAIATLICWLVMPRNRVFLALHFVVAKLYANSFLAALNARIRIRKSRSLAAPDSLPPSSIFPTFAVYPGNTFDEETDEFDHESSLGPPSPSIQVNTSQMVESRYDRNNDGAVTIA